MIEIVTNNNFDLDNYEYAICECTSWNEGIQVPRKEDNYFVSFNCPRCGKELGLFVRQKDPIYSMEELIRKIELILIETGQHDLKFKLGEIIKYSPTEVGEILRKHKDELRQRAMKSMNNEDAVKTLKSWIECMATTNCDYGCEHCHLQIDLNTVSEACAIAITELSQIDDDTVSRKAVLDAIMGEPTDAHYPSWYAERIKALPPSPTVQPDPDTVSRKQANATLQHDATVLGITPYDSGYTPFDAILTLHTLPSSPTPSRPQGYWKGKPIAGFTTVRCSCCGAAFCENDGLWKYCPECGADMRGGRA